MDCITLDSVSKIYGTFAALRNVTTSFCTGSCTVILGENGAGKSTLLRIIAGLITPTRGNVTVFTASPHQQRRRIAYMSHSTMLYDELTAIENLNYFSSLHRDGGCACVGNPEMALRAVGLDPKLNRPVGQYSQGMRQRTSLARVLQTDPEILLLDEPFSNLDAASARRGPKCQPTVSPIESNAPVRLRPTSTSVALRPGFRMIHLRVETRSR